MYLFIIIYKLSWNNRKKKFILTSYSILSSYWWYWLFERMLDYIEKCIVRDGAFKQIVLILQINSVILDDWNPNNVLAVVFYIPPSTYVSKWLLYIGNLDFIFEGAKMIRKKFLDHRKPSHLPFKSLFKTLMQYQILILL